MVQAAARSGLNFRAASTRDRYWWLQASWILDQIENENSIAVYMLQHAQHLAVLDYSLPSQQTFDSHWNGANKALTQIFSLKFPWLGEIKDKGRDSEIDGLMSQWKEKYGDLSDPEVYKKYENIAKSWLSKTDSAKANQFKDQKKLSTTLNKLNKERKKKRRK